MQKRIAGILIICLMVAGSNYLPVKADREGTWVPDTRVPGYLDDTFTPFLLADHNRTVHAFASQWVQSVDRRQAVVYRKWTLKGGWTRPVDIILAPKGDARILGVFMDSSDRIHLIYSSGDERNAILNYSVAPAATADSAAAWSIPQPVGGSLATMSAAISGDDQGHLIIVYSGTSDGSGVYFVESSDAGLSWSDPSPVYLTMDAMLVPYSLQLTRGPNDQVRATWSVVSVLGVNKMLYFANYDLHKAKWSIPAELDHQIDLPDYFGPSFPAMVDNGREIVIMYNNGNPFSGRPVAQGSPVQEAVVSKDNGQTWNGPAAPFPFHIGRSGEHALVVDGAGVPHALFVQRIESVDEHGKYHAIGGLWHSIFTNGNWTNPERFLPSITPHDVRAVVSQGNVLLAVWHEDPGLGEDGVWFSYSVLDAPEAPVVPLSTAEVIARVLPTPTSVPPTETPTPLPRALVEGSSPAQWRNSPAFPLVAGIVPVVLIVTLIIGAYFLMVEREK